MTRTYDMTERGRRAAETGERIVEATERLLTEGPVSGVTLQAIADGAGVSVQTVLRHMGSREGCIEAVKARVLERVEEQRGHTAAGDVEAAVDALVAHYEAEGRLVLNLLTQDDPVAQEATAYGRAYHRAWVKRCFEVSEPLAVDALVAATDLYVWKLLRLDVGRSAETTAAVMTRLVRAALEAP